MNEMPTVGDPSNPDSLLKRDQIQDLIDANKLEPKTRRFIIWTLGWIATFCIAAEIWLATIGMQGSDALLTVAASAVGGIAGMAIPQ